MQRVVDEHNCTEEQAIEIINTAIDRGIRYFDVAWIYSAGQAETRMGKVVKHRQSEMWLATKTWDTTRDGARRQLEESLTRLQTDYVNEWRLHNVWDFARLDEFTAEDGALQAAIEAREQGISRRINSIPHDFVLGKTWIFFVVAVVASKIAFVGDIKNYVHLFVSIRFV